MTPGLFSLGCQNAYRTVPTAETGIAFKSHATIGSATLLSGVVSTTITTGLAINSRTCMARSKTKLPRLQAVWPQL